MTANTFAFPHRAGGGPRVRMCRGCCCGTVRKHPGVDHDAILATLEENIGPRAALVQVDCLWACDLSNVVVVNPAPAAREAGARPAWVPYVNTTGRAAALAQWVRDGGPGAAEPPHELSEILTAAGLRRAVAGGRSALAAPTNTARVGASSPTRVVTTSLRPRTDPHHD